MFDFVRSVVAAALASDTEWRLGLPHAVLCVNWDAPSVRDAVSAHGPFHEATDALAFAQRWPAQFQSRDGQWSSFVIPLLPPD